MILAVVPTEPGIAPWLTVVIAFLAAGIVPAFQYFSKQAEVRAGKGVAEATAKQIDSGVVDEIIARLTIENGRLYTRLDVLGNQVTEMLVQIGRLQQQLIQAGEIPANGPVPPPVDEPPPADPL